MAHFAPVINSISIARSIEPGGKWNKAREVHHYLDVLSLLQQLGAIPASPA